MCCYASKNNIILTCRKRTFLRNELNHQIAELNTFKSLPAVTGHSGQGKPENFHGLVQRLVQKEKQVLSLQSELDRFKSQHPGEGREAVRELPRRLLRWVMTPSA